MRDSMYSNMVLPSSATFTAADADCCNSATGASGAGRALEFAHDAIERAGGSILGNISTATTAPTAPAPATRSCRCWWVALAAVVVIAVVARS